MSKPRSRIVHYAIYLAVRIVVCVFQTLSPLQARRLAAWLAWLAYCVDRRHRQVALDNLRQAFPHRSQTELDVLVRATYRHFCTLLAEFSHMPRKMHAHNCSFYYDLGDNREAVDLLRSDRPLLIITAHLGNWEMAGIGLGHHGLKTYAAARALDNPYLEAYLLRFREHTGQTILFKDGLLDDIREVLAGGGKVAILADQHAGHRGQMTTFFGRPASTHRSVALLCLQHRVPLLVVGNVKVGEPMRYRAVVADIIYPEEYTGRRTEAARAITQRFTTSLERVIRMAPAQYFWLHNRWKEYPARRVDTKAA